MSSRRKVRDHSDNLLSCELVSLSDGSHEQGLRTPAGAVLRPTLPRQGVAPFSRPFPLSRMHADKRSGLVTLTGAAFNHLSLESRESNAPLPQAHPFAQNG